MFKLKAAALQVLLVVTSVVAIAPGASAQGFINKRSNLPDGSSFYMARQQWQVIDNSPIINGQPGGPMQQQPMNGALPAGPAPLPKAGWQPYSQSIPGLQTNLPKTNNGVPPKLPPAPPPGAKANAGKLSKPKQTAAAAAPVNIPPSVQSYTPYKGYNPVPQPAPVMGSAGNSSNSNVHGSLLHWARGRHN